MESWLAGVLDCIYRAVKGTAQRGLSLRLGRGQAKRSAPLILARLQPGEQVTVKRGNRFNGFSCRFHAPRTEKPLKRLTETRGRVVTDLKAGENERGRDFHTAA